VANCLIAYPNYADPQLAPSPIGTPSLLTPSLSGGSWLTALPLGNLVTPYLAQLARSSNALAASTQFDIDLQTARAIRVAALVRHNLSQAATFRIRGSNTAGVFTTPVYDSGTINVFSTSYAPGSLPWGYPQLWTGMATAEDLAYYKSLAFVHVMPELETARYWRIEIVDTANAAGYVQMGRVFLGPGFQPSVNVAFGAALGWSTQTSSQRSEGGVDYFHATPQRREFTGTIEDMPLDQALELVHDMYGRLGKDGQFIFVLDAADQYHMHRRAFLATLKDLPPLVYAYYGTQTAAISCSEVL
jgi:hypothetical protein